MEDGVQWACCREWATWSGGVQWLLVIEDWSGSKARLVGPRPFPLPRPPFAGVLLREVDAESLLLPDAELGFERWLACWDDVEP